MHGFFYPPIYIVENNNFDIFQIITVIITLTAVGIAIWQSILARRSLDITKQAIEDETKTRQLSVLPKLSEIILVQTQINDWIKNLKTNIEKMSEALKSKDKTDIEKIAQKAPKQPKDVILHKMIYEEAPEYLRQIFMSGAQYTYDAFASNRYLLNDTGEPKWDLVSEMIKVHKESLHYVEELNKLISNMVPDVMLNTPASISNSEFLK